MLSRKFSTKLVIGTKILFLAKLLKHGYNGLCTKAIFFLVRLKDSENLNNPILRTVSLVERNLAGRQRGKRDSSLGLFIPTSHNPDATHYTVVEKL